MSKKKDNKTIKSKATEKVEVEKTVVKKKKSKLRENIEIVLWAILIALVIRIFAVEAYRIPSQSLYPNMLIGDQILVNKLVYGVKLPFGTVKLPAFAQPSRGEFVIFQNPRYKSPGFGWELLDLITFSIWGLDQNPDNNPKNFIKRCLALPGDKIEWFEDGSIKINGEILPREKLEVFDYSKVDYGKDAIPQIADMYKETNGKQSYKVQYKNSDDKTMSLNPFLRMANTYYMPKRGDVITIERKNEYSDELIFKIRDIDITSLWEGNREQNVKGLRELFEEESKADFFNKKDLIKRIIENGNKPITYNVLYNYYFMIGDNRDFSEDGRYFGPVRENLIIGSPIFRYWPFNRFGKAE